MNYVKYNQSCDLINQFDNVPNYIIYTDHTVFIFVCSLFKNITIDSFNRVSKDNCL